MSRDQPAKNQDGVREGDKEPHSTTQKTSAESFTAEPQAQPTAKFTTFSGTSDKKLSSVAPSEFVIEDTSKGIVHSARGERSTHAPAQEAVPRQSFMDGLRKIFDAAKSKEEADALQSAFSIQYILEKAKTWVEAGKDAFLQSMPGAAGVQSQDKQFGKPGADPNTTSSHSETGPSGEKVRYISADEAIRQLRSDPTKDVVADADEGDVLYLLAKMNREAQEQRQSGLSSPVMGPEAIDCAATTIHEALNKSVLGSPLPDSLTVMNVVETMNDGDRTLLLKSYKEHFGVDLRVDAATKLSGKEEVQVLTALNGRDRDVDDRGVLLASLAELRQIPPEMTPQPAQDGFPDMATGQVNAENAQRQRFAEKDLRETLGCLGPAELAHLKSGPEGTALSKELLTSDSITSQTKEALAIYLNSGASLTDSDVRRLAEIGLKYHDADIFEEAFLNASDRVRSEFLKDTSRSAIMEAFGPDEGQVATDYVETRGIRTSTLVRGDSHWFGSDAAHVEFALDHATTEERTAYLQAMSALIAPEAEGVKAAPVVPDSAIPIHDDLRSALASAAGTERQLQKWEAQLTRGSENLIVQLASMHDDGMPFLFGSRIHFQPAHDINKILHSVDNMSEQEWNRLHDPIYKEQLFRSLRTYLEDTSDRTEYSDVKYLIDTKITARSYEDSKNDNPVTLGIPYREPKPSDDKGAPRSDLPETADPVDVLKAFVDHAHNVTSQDVKTVLSNPEVSIGELKNQFSSRFHLDMSASVLGEAEPTDRLELIKLMSDRQRTSRMDFYGQRDETRGQFSLVGDSLMTGLSNSSSVDVHHQLNQLYGAVQGTGSVTNELGDLTPAEIDAIRNSVSEGTEYYVAAKRRFAEDMVNHSIGVAAVAGAPFTGGGSWELYTTLFTIGAASKITIKSTIEGASYRKDQVVQDGITGGAGLALSFVGPEYVPKLLGIGKLAAGTTARTVFGSESRSLIQGVTEEQLAARLESITRKVLTHGGKNAEVNARREIGQLAREIATPGHEVEVAALINNSLSKDITNNLKRTFTEYGVMSTAGGIGGGANSALEAGFNDPRNLLSKTGDGFVNAAGTALVFHGLFKTGERAVNHLDAALQKGVKVDLSDASAYSRVKDDPLLGSEKTRRPFDLQIKQEVEVNGESWQISEISHGNVSLVRQTRLEMSYNQLLREFKVPNSEVVAKGSEVVDRTGKRFAVESVDTNHGQKLYRLISSDNEIQKVTVGEFIQAAANADRAISQRLIDHHDDPSVKGLQESVISIDSSGRHSPKNYHGADPPNWYRGSYFDVNTGESIPVLFRVCSDAESLIRMNNEVRGQWLFRELGFKTGGPPSIVRQFEIGGNKCIGFVQELRGDDLSTALPSLLGRKLYGDAHLAESDISVEEIDFALHPNRNPAALLRSLSDRAQDHAGDVRLSHAVERFKSLVNSPRRLREVSQDPQLCMLRSQLEEALVERHILGDFDDHAKNFVIIDEPGHFELRNIDYAKVYPADKPYLKREHDPNLMDKVFPAIADTALSDNTVAHLRRFLASPDTAPRLRNSGFSDKEIAAILSRARFYATHRRFPELHSEPNK